MARGISLERAEQSKLRVANRGEGFRLQITARDAEGMPLEVFGHQKRVIDPYTGQTGEDFCFVCGVSDLVNFPVNEPSPTQTPAYYRKSVIDVILPSQHLAEEVWLLVHEEVCVLVEALNKLDRLAVVETTRCGDAVESSVSESLSESVSASLSASESV